MTAHDTDPRLPVYTDAPELRFLGRWRGPVPDAYRQTLVYHKRQEHSRSMFRLEIEALIVAPAVAEQWEYLPPVDLDPFGHDPLVAELGAYALRRLDILYPKAGE